MKLELSTEGPMNGRGKYGLLKVRVLRSIKAAGIFAEWCLYPDKRPPTELPFIPEEYPGQRSDAIVLSKKVEEAIKTLQSAGVIEWGERGTEGEFFVIKLRDEYARDALSAYANAARADDPEYAAHVYYSLSCKAGPNSPFCKKPD